MGASSSSCVPSTVAPSSTLNERFDRSHSDAVVSRIPFGTSTVPPVGRSPQSSIARCVHCVKRRGNHKGHRACAQQWWRRSTVLKLSAVCANRERRGASAQECSGGELFCESSDVCIGRQASRHGAHSSACRTAVVFVKRCTHRPRTDILNTTMHVDQRRNSPCMSGRNKHNVINAISVCSLTCSAAVPLLPLTAL